MTASGIQLIGTTAGTSPPASVATHRGFSFHDVLSALNPLQYLPVVGTIYRAATGDVIPEALRIAGSLVASGLLGGPVGVISNIVVTIGEKVTGIDPEKIVAAQFHAAPPAEVAGPQPGGTPAGTPHALALSPQQLAAYGVHWSGSGRLQLGEIEGADVLNAVELVRLGKAASAYAANQVVSLAVTAQGGLTDRGR